MTETVSREKASRLRQQVLQTEEARQRHVEALVAAGMMVVGSFVTLGRKCGKPSCHCASGELHYSKFLSRSEGGKSRPVYVRSADEVDIAGKAETYRQFRQARAELMKLADQTARFADELQQQMTEPYPPEATPATRQPRRKRKRKSDGDGES